jgi:prepilin-type N-terminal cleavage/methylation domain-containing protein/prepilin-type processing-associated H-X9-DG protein
MIDMSARRRAFSLVELITVVGIIAILVALLLPMLARVQQAAKSVACQSNLRQIFAAALQRSMEHGGFVQIGGQINRLGDTAPATLNDVDEKRYLWYDDQGERRPAPLQAALAPYLGKKDVRLDSAENMLADIDQGIVKRIFTCPSQVEPLPTGLMIGSDTGWTAPAVPTSYAFNEGLLGFEDTPRRRRGDLRAARPSADVIFLTDAIARTESFQMPYIAWVPATRGRCSLADCYTNAHGTYDAGVASQFDYFRHPHFRVNIVFCDGHVDSLIIRENELSRALVLGE